jgi:hypothetical protein
MEYGGGTPTPFSSWMLQLHGGASGGYVYKLDVCARVFTSCCEHEHLCVSVCVCVCVSRERGRLRPWLPSLPLSLIQ